MRFQNAYAFQCIKMYDERPDLFYVFIARSICVCIRAMRDSPLFQKFSRHYLARDDKKICDIFLKKRESFKNKYLK